MREGQPKTVAFDRRTGHVTVQKMLEESALESYLAGEVKGLDLLPHEYAPPNGVRHAPARWEGSE